jgi:hypothetical protein
MAESNGKWQLAFWIMGIISITMWGGLTYAVVDNENRNVDTHKEMVKERTDMFREMMKENESAHSAILQRLSRIEALLK